VTYFLNKFSEKRFPGIKNSNFSFNKDSLWTQLVTLKLHFELIINKYKSRTSCNVCRRCRLIFSRRLFPFPAWLRRLVLLTNRKDEKRRRDSSTCARSETIYFATWIFPVVLVTCFLSFEDL